MGIHVCSWECLDAFGLKTGDTLSIYFQTNAGIEAQTNLDVWDVARVRIPYPPPTKTLQSTSVQNSFLPPRECDVSLYWLWVGVFQPANLSSQRPATAQKIFFALSCVPLRRGQNCPQ